jgi:hypothetical protein
MRMARLSRAVAVAICIAAAIDPPVRSSRDAPVPIEIRTPDGGLVPAEGGAAASQATRLRSALTRALGSDAEVNGGEAPAAVVVAGDGLSPGAVPSTGQVSFITSAAPGGPRIRVVSVRDPQPVLPGWAATVAVEVQGSGMATGSTSDVLLESEGIQLDRVEHRWTAPDETFRTTLAFTPPAPGLVPLRVRATDAAGSADLADATATTGALAESRRLRVLSFDPRPSWASGFVRRVLEEGPDFEVETRVRASKGLEVRTGEPPASINAAALDRFDLVLVGAPEDLGPGEIAALESFARVRGGTVVLIADRRPSGAYSALVGDVFDESLVDKPLTLTAADGTRLRASELAFPRVLPAGADAIVSMPQAGTTRAPILILPLGAGRVFFSGALDAWRYRGDEGAEFAAFWRSHLGREALRAPRQLEASVSPAVAVPGAEILVRASIRATQLTHGGTGSPAISSEVIDGKGALQQVRLWPTAERGVSEGRIRAEHAGRYDVKVQTDTGLVVETPLLVREGQPAVRREAEANAARVGEWTGGVVVGGGELGALVQHLRALPRSRVTEVLYPMRSPWWAAAFVGLLAAEWATRRRRGLR